MDSLLNIGCFTHYAVRFYFKMKFGTMYFNTYSIVTFAHLWLSLVSFSSPVPKVIKRFDGKLIASQEFRVNNILMTSRSLCMIYHTLFFTELNPYYYCTRLGIIFMHHYIADFVKGLYHIDDYNRSNIANIYHNLTNIFTTGILLISNNPDNGFITMFPIQLSALLMTLVEKKITSNKTAQFLYSLSLSLPLIVNMPSISAISSYLVTQILGQPVRIYLHPYIQTYI